MLVSRKGPVNMLPHTGPDVAENDGRLFSSVCLAGQVLLKDKYR